MAVNYSIALMSNPVKPEDGKKAYACAQYTTKLSLKALSQRISLQTTLTRADVYAVIVAAVDNVILALREGNLIELGELGTFRLSLMSTGAASVKEFTTKNIIGAKVLFSPGEDLRNFEGLEFELVPSRAMQVKMKQALKNGEVLGGTDDDEENDAPTTDGSGDETETGGSTDTGNDDGNDEGGDDFGV